MERSGRHPSKAVTVVVRAALVLEETSSAFHPRGGGGVYSAVIHGIMHERGKSWSAVKEGKKRTIQPNTVQPLFRGMNHTTVSTSFLAPLVPA